MKRYLMYLLIFLAIIMNAYLIFYWEPINQDKTRGDMESQVITYSKPLYKINKGKALEQLSYDEKKDLEEIIKKLSAFDIGKIKGFYEDSDEDKGVISILKLLKKRLASADYKRVEEISSSFLDLKRVNEMLKNN